MSPNIPVRGSISPIVSVLVLPVPAGWEVHEIEGISKIAISSPAVINFNIFPPDYSFAKRPPGPG
jgi:hypothetical protein